MFDGGPYRSHEIQEVAEAEHVRQQARAKIAHVVLAAAVALLLGLLGPIASAFTGIPGLGVVLTMGGMLGTAAVGAVTYEVRFGSRPTGNHG